MERRKRRSFNAEFKAEAVRQVREGGKSVPQVAKDLDLTDSALRNWVKQAGVEKNDTPRSARRARRARVAGHRAAVRRVAHPR